VRAGLAALAGLGGELVVEELLEGPEVSLFALCDGHDAVPLPAVHDYKRANDGDTGPNTGGMGAYAPSTVLGETEAEELVERVHGPVLRELASRGAPFVGLLYAGLMLTARGPRVLEFNCRFGDPETQALVPLLDGDLGAALLAAATGRIEQARHAATGDAAVTVVLAAGEYPAAGDQGSPIAGVEEAKRRGGLVFHAGTASHDGRLVTNGGRILAVTGCAATLSAARQAAYEAADAITFAGARRRDDIALLTAVPAR